MNQKVIVPVVILLVAGMLFFFNMSPVPEGYVDYRAVEAQEQLAQHKNVTLLDIRTPAEFHGGHIPGAINIDYYAKNFEAELNKLDKDIQYFVYCRTGNRSSSALKMMQKFGFTKVWHLNKGIVDWKSAGLPIAQ